MNGERRTFISYAREDADAARRMHLQLQEAGVHPWLDEEALLPGQTWEQEIEKSIRLSTHFIALISQNSVTKSGYCQKELRKALDVLETIPPNKIFFIPARLDDSEPEYPALQRIHRVDLFPDWNKGMEKIFLSLGISGRAQAKHIQDKFGTPTISQELSDQQVLAKIREVAARDHPHDFSTQKFVIDNQVKAWQTLKRFTVAGVPNEVISAILSNAKKEHPFDFSTQLFVVENQLKAWRNLYQT